jgi:hypothetical protein
MFLLTQHHFSPMKTSTTIKIEDTRSAAIVVAGLSQKVVLGVSSCNARGLANIH